MYNLTYQLLFFFFLFFPNNVGSYNPRSNPSIYNPNYLPWFYVGSRFWQPIIYILMECITYIIIPCHICSYFVRPSLVSNFFMDSITYIYIYIYTQHVIYSYFERLSVASNIFNGRYNIYNYTILYRVILEDQV